MQKIETGGAKCALCHCSNPGATLGRLRKRETSRPKACAGVPGCDSCRPLVSGEVLVETRRTMLEAISAHSVASTGCVISYAPYAVETSTCRRSIRAFARSPHARVLRHHGG